MTHKKKLERCRNTEKVIKHLSLMNLIYRLGGARGSSRHNGIHGPISPGQEWTDCSGFALFIMSILGIKAENPGGWTGTLVKEGEAGESDYFTLFIKEPFNTEGHVILRLRKRPRPWHFGVPRYRWAECGGMDNPKAGDGPTYFRPTKARIAEFPYHRHFPEF